MIAVLWGLLGATLIGASDCIARVTAQRVSMSVLFLFVMGLSTVALSLFLGLQGDLPPLPIGEHAGTLYGWAASMGSGLLNILVLYLLYRALARGPVAVASPAASTFTILLIVINVLAGEPLTLLQAIAGIAVFAGVAMLARRQAVDDDNQAYDASWIRTTAFYGLASAVCISVRMFLAQEAGTALDPMSALYLNRVFALAGTLVMLAAFLITQQNLLWPDKDTIPLVLVQTFLEMAALGAFLYGSVGDGRVGAAIGFSAFSALTALFAWAWLGERIGLKRGLWMLVVLAGLILATVA